MSNMFRLRQNIIIYLLIIMDIFYCLDGIILFYTFLLNIPSDYLVCDHP